MSGVNVAFGGWRVTNITQVAFTRTALQLGRRVFGGREGHDKSALEAAFTSPGSWDSAQLSPAQLALVDVDGAFRPIAGTYDVWLGSTGPPPFGTFTNDVTAPLHSTLSLTGASQLANENKVGVLAAQA